MTKRHEHTHARWCAVQALYAAEVRGQKPNETVEAGKCLYTGDVLDELSEAVTKAEASWEPLYQQWLQDSSQNEEAGEEPTLEDIDMSEYASVAALPEYAIALVNGVEEHQEELDARLGEVSSNWSIERMPIADRCILRLAAFEMLYVDETPISVSINEAVDLAKYFGGQNESAPFINGVLGNIARSLEAQSAAGEASEVAEVVETIEIAEAAEAAKTATAPEVADAAEAAATEVAAANVAEAPKAPEAANAPEAAGAAAATNAPEAPEAPEAPAAGQVASEATSESVEYDG